jgi:hypothetical protein
METPPQLNSTQALPDNTESWIILRFLLPIVKQAPLPLCRSRETDDKIFANSYLTLFSLTSASHRRIKAN